MGVGFSTIFGGDMRDLIHQSAAVPFAGLGQHESW